MRWQHATKFRILANLLVLGAGLQHCGVEELNRTGTIRAADGGANQCPATYGIRWGRCCPSNSTIAQCPVNLPRDTTGTVYPPESGQCPNNYELRLGQYCCPSDAGAECPPGELGSPCDNNEDCRLYSGADRGLSPFCFRPTDSTFDGLPFRPPQGYCSVQAFEGQFTPDAGFNCGASGELIEVPLVARFCMRACENLSGQAYQACPQTNGQLSCNQYGVNVLGFPVLRYSFCFPDCVVDPSVCHTYSIGMMNSVTAECNPNTHYCAVRCSGLFDDGRCVNLGYARCNQAAGFCEY